MTDTPRPMIAEEASALVLRNRVQQLEDEAFRAGWAAAYEGIVENETDFDAPGFRQALAAYQRELSETRSLTVEGASAEAEIQRLRAASQWQPIETAPKDGTPVLAWDEGAVCIVTWVSGDPVDPDGWYDVRRLDPAPTHWQPLPPAPEGVKRG